MGNFWSDRIAERRPQVQPRGAWWREPSDASVRPQEPRRDEYSTNQSTYTPEASARLNGGPERCPRCGSEDYVEVPLDVSYGGRSGMAETGVNLGKSKRCFGCRYPSFDSSGTLVRGMSGGKAKKQQVRQLGGGDVGSWGGEASWDSAQLIA